MKKLGLILLIAAIFSLLLFSSAAAVDATHPVTPEQFEKDMKTSSTLGQVRTDVAIDDDPRPDFSDSNLVFNVPAWRAKATDPATGNVISESVIPLKNTVAAVHGDVALLLEKEDGWIYSWPPNGPIPLTPGSYTLSGSRNLDEGEKVLIVETDGTMHAFYSGGVENNFLTVGDDSLEVYTCLAGLRSREANKTFDVDTKINLPKGMGYVRLHGTITLDTDIDAGVEWYGWYVFLNSISVTPNFDLVEVYVQKFIEPVNTEITHIEIPIIDGIAGISLSPRYFLDVTVEGDVGFTFESKASMHGKIRIVDIGGIYVVPTGFGGDLDTPTVGFIGATVGGEVYTGLQWGPGIDVFGGLAEIGVQAKVGPVVEGFVMIGHLYPDDPAKNRYHACESLKCVQGDVHLRIGPAGVYLFTGSDAKELYRIVDPYDTDPFAEFYRSFDYGDGSIQHMCPHEGYKLLVSVVDQDNNPVKDAVAGFTPFETQFKDVAENVKIGDDGYWTLYVPKSNPTVDDKDSNTVTVTASVADPLDPFSTLSVSAEITEKGMQGDAPDPKDLTLQLDMTVCTLSFQDTETGEAKNIPDPISFHPWSGTLKIPDNIPEKSGRVFTGWNTEEDGSGTAYAPGATITLDSDQTLWAQWRIAGNDWYVIYNANGGTKAPQPQIVLKGQDAVLSSELPEAGKMIFKGWTPDLQTMDPVYQPGDILPYDSEKNVIVLYAIWNLSPVPQPIHISFDANGAEGASLPPEIWMEQNTWVQMEYATPPLGSAYTFCGWSEDPDAEDPVFLPGHSYYFYKSVTLYAIWEKLKSVTLTFRDPLPDASSGIPDPISILPSMSRDVQIPDAIPQKSGRVFTGWNTAQDGSGDSFAPGSVFTLRQDSTLWAQWELAGNSWYIIYNAHGGTKAPGAQIVPRGQDAVLSKELPEFGKMVFKGWTPDLKTLDPVYQPGNTLPYDSGKSVVVLYALWELDPAKRPVVISFDANGGRPETAPQKISAPQGAWVRLPDTGPSWDVQHSFLGWTTDPQAKEPTWKAGDSVLFDRNTTLYAVWYAHYRVIEGAGSVWTKGSGKTQRFAADGDVKYFIELRVDGRPFETGVKISSGSTVAEISARAMETLSVGNHTVTFVYVDGEASASFAVQRKLPPTGDTGHPALWLSLIALGIAGLVLPGTLKRTIRRKK